MTADPFEGTPYRKLALIGRGGMSEVFKVEHRELGASFAAKLLHEWLAEHPQIVDRVRLEAQTLGQLEHPNIVAITAFAETPDRRPYIVMELLSGRSLAAECEQNGAMSAFGAVFFTRQLLGGLGAAHELGVVHRDIKPNNLFLHEHDNGERTLKILDFGVACVLERFQQRTPLPLAYPTEGGALLGTPRFMSPEAIAGQRVDHRADLYGAGLALYQMLTGHDPFRHLKGEERLLSAHATEEPRPPSQIARKPIPHTLDSIVLKALAKNPARRFQSTSEFDNALAAVAATLVPSTSWAQTTGFVVRTGGDGEVLPVPNHPLLHTTLTLGTMEQQPPLASETPVATTETVAPELAHAGPPVADEEPPSVTPTSNPPASPPWVLALVFLLAATVGATLAIAAVRVFAG